MTTNTEADTAAENSATVFIPLSKLKKQLGRLPLMVRGSSFGVGI
jgi:hypothetical protein